MAGSKEAPPRTSEVRQSGAYLTDGTRLYRVLDAGQAHVKLENCRHPQENGSWYSIKKVLRDMRVVRTLRS